MLQARVVIVLVLLFMRQNRQIFNRAGRLSARMVEEQKEELRRSIISRF